MLHALTITTIKDNQTAKQLAVDVVLDVEDPAVRTPLTETCVYENISDTDTHLYEDVSDTDFDKRLNENLQSGKHDLEDQEQQSCSAPVLNITENGSNDEQKMSFDGFVQSTSQTISGRIVRINDRKGLAFQHVFQLTQ